MKKITKIAALLLSVILSCGSIAGCSGSSDSDDNNVTTVTVWSGNGHDKVFMKNMVEKYNKSVGKEKGIKIDYIVKEGGNLSQMLELAFTTDQAPDLFAGASISKYSEEGYIIALEDVPGGKELVEKYKDHLLAGRQVYKGKTYGLPRSTSTQGLIYNKDMFRAAGLVDENGEPTPPKTLDELVEYAKILTNNEKREYGIVFPGKWSYWFASDMNQGAAVDCGFIDGYNPATGKYDYSGLLPIAEAYLKIKKNGSCFPGSESLENDPARARFAEGGIGMKYSFSFDVGVLTDQFPAKCDWGVAPLPVADENNRYMQACSSGIYLAINKNSIETKNADKIMEVFKWFHSDELLREAYKYGLEIPLDFDIVKDIDSSTLPNGWKEFAELAEISKPTVAPMPYDLSGNKGLDEIWMEVWAGKVTLDEFKQILKDYGDLVNEGVKKYQELQPDFDPELYIFKDWNAKI